MTQHECVQLDHVLQMYHVGYHKGHRPSSIRKAPVESATSITVQIRRGGPRTSGVAAGKASTAFALQPPPPGKPPPFAYQRANILHAPSAAPRHRVAALPRPP